MMKTSVLGRAAIVSVRAAKWGSEPNSVAKLWQAQRYCSELGSDPHLATDEIVGRQSQPPRWTVSLKIFNPIAASRMDPTGERRFGFAETSFSGVPV